MNKTHFFRRLTPGLTVLLLGLTLMTENAEASKVLCDGRLVRKQEVIGSYKLDLTYRMPRGGQDKSAVGKGMISIRNADTGRIQRTKINCQLDLDLPGGLMCISAPKANSEEAVTVEVHASKSHRHQNFKIFVGAWDSKPAAVAHRQSDCKTSGL